jgi:hypothetical protein
MLENHPYLILLLIGYLVGGLLTFLIWFFGEILEGSKFNENWEKWSFKTVFRAVFTTIVLGIFFCLGWPLYFLSNETA